MKNRTSMPRSGKRETCGLPRVAIRAGSATVEAALGAPPGARPTAALGAALPAGEPPPGRAHGRPAEESRLRQPPGSAPAAAGGATRRNTTSCLARGRVKAHCRSIRGGRSAGVRGADLDALLPADTEKSAPTI